MKNLLFASFAFTLLCSCVQDEKIPVDPLNLSEEERDSLISEIDFDLNAPVFITNTDVVLFPLSNKSQTKKWKEKGSYDRSYQENSILWNVLFFNRKSQSSSLLTDNKTYITRIDANLDKCGPILSKSILYEMIITDFNKDNTLDFEDPGNLYISDNSGNVLKRLSPENEHLITYEIVPDTDQLFIHTRSDSDADKQFTINDASNWYFLDLSTGKEPSAILDQAMNDSIVNLYFDHWIKR